MHKYRSSAKRAAWYDDEEDPPSYNPFKRILRNGQADIKNKAEILRVQTEDNIIRNSNDQRNELNGELHSPVHANTMPATSSGAIDYPHNKGKIQAHSEERAMNHIPEEKVSTLHHPTGSLSFFASRPFAKMTEPTPPQPISESLEEPPAYSPGASISNSKSPEDKYAFLTQFDTVFLTDDNVHIMNDEEALKPDPGTEEDFEVEDNKFAFTPGQLNKLINPKSLSAFQALGGLTGLEKRLRTNTYSGINLSMKRDRDPPRNSNNQMFCDHEQCAENPPIFGRPCEWNKHMDKHDRPYKLREPGCDKIQGCTYSGGLLRRRGRGKRRNDAYWMDYNSRDDSDPFDGRECLFADGNGHVRTPAMADLDTGLKVPGGLIMSSQYAKELGRYQDISQDFADPCLRSISGHLTPVSGILRDVVFRLKGTSVTFKRDFFICDAIDGLVDIMFGASFIKAQFKLLFERVKECFSTFATWFSTKKESKEEKAKRERRERDQTIKANQREIARLQKEQEMLEAAQRQS